VEGRSREALLVLRLIIACISLISTLLVILLTCNENIISIDSLDFSISMVYISGTYISGV
jgi:hypothetical protein